jgi:hypothetical protein
LIAKIAIIFFSIAIIAVVTATMLVPLMISPPPSPILMNKTVTLTDDSFDVGYPLTLARGERIEVKASGNGQPIDFRITDNQSSAPLVEEEGNTFYDLPWTVPAYDTYIFHVSARAGNVTATMIVVKS